MGLPITFGIGPKQKLTGQAVRPIFLTGTISHHLLPPLSSLPSDTSHSVFNIESFARQNDR
jgi:hypothetical protein